MRYILIVTQSSKLQESSLPDSVKDVAFKDLESLLPKIV